MKTCPVCSQATENGTVICPKCNLNFTEWASSPLTASKTSPGKQQPITAPLRPKPARPSDKELNWKVILLIGVVLVLGLWYSQTPPTVLEAHQNAVARENWIKNRLIGSWRGKSLSGEELRLVFRVGGVFRVKKGERINTGAFKADYRRTPLHLDIMFRRSDTNKTIAELVDKDTLLFEEKESSAGRPSSFGKGKRVLRRQSAAPLSEKRLKELMGSD